MSLSSIASIGRGMSRKAPRSGGFTRRNGPHIHHAYPARGHVHKNMHRKGPRGVPPISICVQDMDDQTLVTLAAIDDHSSREEILKRHIMDIDNVSYPIAETKFAIIAEQNIKGYYMVALPYKIGIVTATALGIWSVPMIYHLPTVEWFNELAVTMDHPPSSDLDTPLEVSMWSWSWMEPSLGTMSFLLLCMQYIRGQMVNLGIKPYTGWIKGYRGKNLADTFPQYDSKILTAYSETANLLDWRKSFRSQGI